MCKVCNLISSKIYRKNALKSTNGGTDIFEEMYIAADRQSIILSNSSSRERDDGTSQWKPFLDSAEAIRNSGGNTTEIFSYEYPFIIEGKCLFPPIPYSPKTICLHLRIMVKGFQRNIVLAHRHYHFDAAKHKINPSGYREQM